MKLGSALWIGLLLTAVLLAIGCSNSTEPKNQNPSLPQIHPDGFTILPNGRVLMSASATDPDGDAVTYRWIFSAGSPETVVADTVTWAAPASGEVTVTCKARDGKGGERIATSTVTIHPNAAYAYGRPFEGTIEPAMDDLGGTGSRGFCHFSASVMVDWTTATVLVYTGVPTAAFLKAFTTTPVWIPPATWIWTYAVPWGTSYAVVELHAALNGPAALDWNMYISGTIQDFNRFEWVTGQSSTDAISGYWLLYDYRYPAQHLPALRIEYDRASDTERDLDYFNVLQSSSGYGDSLSYGLHGTEAEVKLDRVGPPVTSTRAVWDISDGHGRYYGAGGDSCCWGPRPTFPDVDCP